MTGSLCYTAETKQDCKSIVLQKERKFCSAPFLISTFPGENRVIPRTLEEFGGKVWISLEENNRESLMNILEALTGSYGKKFVSHS